MTVQDRTREFFAAIESTQARGTGAMHASSLIAGLQNDRQPLLQSRAPASLYDTAASPASPFGTTSVANTLGQPPQRRSEFARRAASVGMEINTAAAKLERLMKLARKKSLFDDSPEEIQGLTEVVKQDITRINAQIRDLERHLREQAKQAGSAANRQTQEHSSSIVVSLQSKLATTSTAFKDILELRSQTMQEQKERRDMFSNPSTNAAAFVPKDYQSSLYAPEVHRRPYAHAQGVSTTMGVPPVQPSGGGGNSIAIDMPMQQQQSQMMVRNDPSNAIIESRTAAIESIEQTIGEMAGMFQQLTSMIMAHDNMIERIDRDVESAESNVTAGTSELMKYMNSISSNRWLMIRMFMVVIFFFLLFVLVFA